MSLDLDRTQRLVLEARAGRREAFEELFGSQRPRLQRALRGRIPLALVPRLDVSDVVQAALVDAFRGLERFEDRGAGSFVRWLRRIAENRLKMELGRHLGRSRRELGRETAPVVGPGGGCGAVFGSGFELGPERAASITSPSSAAGRDERRELLEGALQRLSADHREVLHRVRIESCSIAETALAMGRSENAVKKLLARALLELGDQLPSSAGP